jgi:hypothetical protein
MMILHVCDSVAIAILDSIMHVEMCMFWRLALSLMRQKDIDCSESVRMNYSFPSAFLMKLAKLSDITYAS